MPLRKARGVFESVEVVMWGWWWYSSREMCLAQRSFSDPDMVTGTHNQSSTSSLAHVAQSAQSLRRCGGTAACTAHDARQASAIWRMHDSGTVRHLRTA
jgi:hypothetical protein